MRPEIVGSTHSSNLTTEYGVAESNPPAAAPARGDTVTRVTSFLRPCEREAGSGGQGAASSEREDGDGDGDGDAILRGREAGTEK